MEFCCRIQFLSYINVLQLVIAYPCIQELLLDLDSHRSLVHALTGVLTHLSEHGATETIGEMELERLKDRLSKTLQWWNQVCHNAASWQARLQIALLEVSHIVVL